MLSLRRLLPLSACALALAFPVAGAQNFETTAPHAIIMDAATGRILFEKDAALPMAPASMTKIMTASLVFDRIRDGSITTETKFKVSEEAWRKGGSKMFVELGSEISVGDLLRGVIVQSGNDACIVLAEGIAGSETAFADMMTARARELGLSSATFLNATGWPAEGHEISARDLAVLARYVTQTYPEFYSLYGERSFTWNNIKQSNRNPLLGKFTGADGMKTGHTEISKYGLVGSAKRGEDRRIVVVNGLETSADRSSESIRMMRAAFDSFKIYDLFDSGSAVTSAPVFMGKSETVSLVAGEDIDVGIYRPLRKKMTVRARFDGPIAAPITKGDQLGQLVVSVPGRADDRFPLLAGEDIGRKGAFGRAMTSLKSKF